MSDARGQPGWKEVLLVAVAVLAAVFVASILTGAIEPLHSVVTRTPAAILLLVVGTALVLWRLASRPPPD